MIADILNRAVRIADEVLRHCNKGESEHCWNENVPHERRNIEVGLRRAIPPRPYDTWAATCEKKFSTLVLELEEEKNGSDCQTGFAQHWQRESV